MSETGRVVEVKALITSQALVLLWSLTLGAGEVAVTTLPQLSLQVHVAVTGTIHHTLPIP